MNDDILPSPKPRSGRLAIVAVVLLAVLAGCLVVGFLLSQHRYLKLEVRLHTLEQQGKLKPSLVVVERLKADVSELSEKLSQQAARLTALESSFAHELKENSAFHQNLNQSQTSVREQLTLLEAKLSALQAQQQRPAPASDTLPAAKPVAPVARKIIPSVPRPPFVLTGIETRGNQSFAAIAPRGFSVLSQITLLAPGEHSAGWTLTAIERAHAAFEHQGVKRRLQVSGGEQ